MFKKVLIANRGDKIIEESPSTALTPDLRQRMGEAAVRAVKAAETSPTRCLSRRRRRRSRKQRRRATSRFRATATPYAAGLSEGIGLSLEKSRMPIDQDRPQGMSMSVPGLQAFFFDTVASTNETAKELVRDRQLTCRGYVAAREQTAGRGQRGRIWSSPRDAGIYLSVVDRPENSPIDLTVYTLAAGVACVEAMREATGLTPSLRPINDLYVDGRKLGGILTEAVIEQGRVCALITGIGVNLRRVDHAIEDAQVPPISLQDLLPAEQFVYLDRMELIHAVARGILAWNARVSESGGDFVREAWRRYRSTAGVSPEAS